MSKVERWKSFNEIASIDMSAGDQGYTHLLGGAARKDSLRAEAIGDVDELNALLGLCLARTRVEKSRIYLKMMIGDLFVLGTELACSAGPKQDLPSIKPANIDFLEGICAELLQSLPRINKFVRPIGPEQALLLNSARSVCRRAERHVVAIHMDHHDIGQFNQLLLAYLNRLGAALYLMFRMELSNAGAREEYWSGQDCC